MKYTCREATNEDERDICAFQLAMAKETEGLCLNQSVLKKGVKIPFDHADIANYFIIQSDEQVAVAMLMITKEFRVLQSNFCWWIQSVYTMPEHRGRGCFRMLFDFVKNLALSRGDTVSGLRLYVEEENNSAQCAYKRLGMIFDPFCMIKKMKGDF